jgi:hypothetical protein
MRWFFTIRRFMFPSRLRTLLTGLTIVAVALAIPPGWRCIQEVSIAQERKAALTLICNRGGDYQRLLGLAPDGMSIIRRWCGDVPITTIWLPKPRDGPDAERIKLFFPEAQVLGE